MSLRDLEGRQARECAASSSVSVPLYGALQGGLLGDCSTPAPSPHARAFRVKLSPWTRSRVTAHRVKLGLTAILFRPTLSSRMRRISQVPTPHDPQAIDVARGLRTYASNITAQM